MPVGFYANFAWTFIWLAHMVMETRSEVAGKSVTKTGKKVLPLIRSLSRDGQYGALAKKAPTDQSTFGQWRRGNGMS
jgi:hypothetical protein